VLNIDDILDANSDSQVDMVGTRTVTEEAVKELDPTKLTASEFRSNAVWYWKSSRLFDGKENA